MVKNKKIDYSFFGEYKPIMDNRSILITGIQRSGTTLLGKIVGSLENIEYEYEPNVIHQLAILWLGNLINKKMGSEMLKFQIEDCFINHVLGRNINLRKTDDSRKTLSLNEENIEWRWINLKNRNDAEKYIREKKCIFTFKSANSQPFLPLIYNMFTGQKVIHIIRNVSDVTLSIEKIGWYKDNIIRKSPLQTLRKSVNYKKKKYYIPWWVKNNEIEKFIKYSNSNRCLLCWNTILSTFLEFKKNTNIINNKNYLELKYEDLIQNSEKILNQIERFVKKRRTKKTNYILNQIISSNSNKNKNFFKLNKHEIKTSKIIMKEFGYQINY